MRMAPRPVAGGVTLAVVLAGIAVAGDRDAVPRSGVRVELIDGEPIEGKRVELVRDGLVVEDRRVPAGRLLRWDRFDADPQAGKAKSAPGVGGRDEVRLAGGDRLICRVESIDDEHLVVRWPLVAGQSAWRIPLEQVRTVVLRGAPKKIVRRSLARDRRRPADELWLRGGDRLSGDLKGLADGVVVLATESGSRRVARESVAVLSMNPELQVASRRPSRHVRVGFVDGSRLTAAWPKAMADGLIRLVFDDRTRHDVAVRSIRSVQYFGNPVVRLPGMKPRQAVHTPFLGAVRPPVVDGSIGGGPLIVAGRWTASGLGVTSRTRMTWALGRHHRRFCARVAIDDSADGAGDVVFRVLVDGRAAWSSGPLTGRDRPKRVGPIDLEGAGSLTLEVDYGRRADAGDHAVWLDPRLLTD